MKQETINMHESFYIPCTKNHGMPMLITDDNRDDLLCRQERHINFLIYGYQLRSRDSPFILYASIDVLKYDDSIERGCDCTLYYQENIDEYTQSEFVENALIQLFPLLSDSLWSVVLDLDKMICDQIIGFYKKSFAYVYELVTNKMKN